MGLVSRYLKYLFCSLAIMGLREICEGLNEFMASCIEVGLAPSWAVPGLIDAHAFLKKALKFSSYDSRKSLKYLAMFLAVLVKRVTPFVMKRSHSIVERPTRDLSLFEYRLYCQLTMVDMQLRQLNVRHSRAMKECLFLVSEWVREGPENVKLDQESFVIRRNEKLFVNEPVEVKEEWVAYEHVDFPIRVRSPNVRRKTCCWFVC
jgi:hypothetical protein